MAMTEREVLDFILEHFSGSIGMAYAVLESMEITKEGDFLMHEDGDWIQNNREGDWWLNSLIEAAIGLKNAIASRRDSQVAQSE